MVAIVTGNGLGLEKSSGSIIGARGQLGGAFLGRGNEGVTINAANGNLIVGQQDELLIGRGPDSVINRTYNSQGVYNDDNGDNWRLGIQRRLKNWTGTTNTSGATVTRTSGDGTDIVYTYDSSRGLYLTRDGSGAYDTIQYTEHWIRKDGDTQVTEHYDSGGNLIWQSDSDGNSVSYQYTWYNNGYRLSRALTADGGYTDFSWNGNNLESLTTGYTDTQTGSARTLTRTRYAYTANRLTKVTVDLSPDDSSVADGRVYETAYAYDGIGRLISIAQSDGSLLTFAYDGSNRIASFTQSVEPGVSRITSFAYGSGYTSITDPQGNVTSLYYDGAGQLIRKDEPAPVAGGDPIISKFIYDGNGALVRTSTHNSVASYLSDASDTYDYVHYRYDSNGNLFDTYTYRSGGGYEVVRHYYDSSNNLLSTTSYTAGDGDGHGGSEPTGGMTTRYVYDSENHLRFAITPESRVTEYRYDSFGNRVAEITYQTSAGGSHLPETFNWTEQDFFPWLASISDKSTTARVDTTYDFRGNISMVTAYARVDVAGNGILDEGASRTFYVYDQFGSLLSKRTITGTPGTTLSSLSSFGTPNLSIASAGTIAGKPAYQFSLQTPGAWTYLSANVGAAVEGDVFTTSFVLKDTGNNTSLSIGLLGHASGWGTKDISVARIVSGPGQLVQELGGLWELRGLSSTVETRVEVTRLYRQSEGADLYLYVDRPDGFRAGAGLIISDPIVSKAPSVFETYAYDGMGRAIRFTNAKGVGTWTTYADSQNRTIVTHANGLVQTSTYNGAGQLLASSEVNGGYAGDNLNPNLANWNAGGVTGVSAGTLGGVPATKYTVSTGGAWSAVYSYVTASAGETFTLSTSLKAVAGSTTTQYLGLYGDSSGWPTSNTSSARIISGPGTISQHYGGMWRIDGLSATEETRVEIVRTYLQAETGGAYIYIDAASYGAGQQLIIGAPNLHSSRYGALTNSTNAAHFDIGNWGATNLAPVGAGTVGIGSPARQFTVQNNGAWSAAYTYFNVKAGDTVTSSIVLKGTSTGSSASFGVYGDLSGWGHGSEAASTGRIISGPGSITVHAGGLWNITGLVEGVETRVEITRTLDRDQNGGVYLYPDLPAGWISGHAIVAGAPSVTITPGSLRQYKYDAAGNLRIQVDEAGNRTFSYYDNLNRKIGEVAANGAVTEYRYDTRDRLIMTVVYGTAYPAGQIAGLYDVFGNPTAVTFATIKSQIGASATDRYQWNIYDATDNLIETIDGRGYATAFYYDAAGRLLKTTRYEQQVHANNGQLLENFKVTPPTSFIQPAPNTSYDRSTRNFYDSDGRLVGTLDAELYLTEFVYDGAGRKTETIRRYNQASAGYGPSGAFQTAPVGTFADVKTNIGSHAKDIREYTVYDGRGLVAAAIDGEGNVTRFAYDARGEVRQEVRGQKVSAATAYTFASLPAASGQLQVTNYVRDALGQVTSQTDLLSSGNLTSTMAYSWTGDATTATDARGNATNRYYDALGRLARVDTPIGTGSAYASTFFEYDARGNLVKTTDARGNVSYNYYDERSRLVLAIDAEGYATQTTYTVFGDILSVTRYFNRASGIGNLAVPPTVATHACDATTSFTYDVLGQVLTTTDAEGGIETAYYNAFGEKYYTVNKLDGGESYAYTRRGQLYYSYNNKQVIRHDGSVQANGNYDELFIYDAFGNVILKVEAYNTSERRDTSYAYDRANRLVTKYLPAVSVYNPSTGTEALISPSENYTYDARGNLIETVASGGVRNLAWYDELDRKIVDLGPTGAYTAYTYDANGNLATVKAYDALLNMPPIAAGGTPPAAPTGVTVRETRYAYDRSDRLIETRVPSVRHGQVSGSTFSWTVADLVTSIGYDAMGNIIRETDARGNSVYRYYDKLGRELGKVDQEKYLTVWTRDSEGNVLEEKRFANVPATGLNEFSSLSDIIYWTPTSSADRITQFTYDRMGRRRTETRLAVAASTTSGNAVSTWAQNATITYSYNAFGEVLTKTEATGTSPNTPTTPMAA